eukprot:14196681-Alexandrium_andersonii.AAC.1
MFGSVAIPVQCRTSLSLTPIFQARTAAMSKDALCMFKLLAGNSVGPPSRIAPGALHVLVGRDYGPR